MKDHETQPEGRGSLREWLRRGDPAGDGAGPGPEETAAWRRAMVRAIPEGSRPRPFGARLAAAGAAGAVLILAAAVVWIGRRGPEIAATGGAGRDPRAHVVSARSRTIHFQAPNGTRIIWTLNPDLVLPEFDERQPAQGETS